MTGCNNSDMSMGPWSIEKSWGRMVESAKKGVSNEEEKEDEF